MGRPSRRTARRRNAAILRAPSLVSIDGAQAGRTVHGPLAGLDLCAHARIWDQDRRSRRRWQASAAPPPWRACSIRPTRARSRARSTSCSAPSRPDAATRAPKMLVVPHAGYRLLGRRWRRTPMRCSRPGASASAASCCSGRRTAWRCAAWPLPDGRSPSRRRSAASRSTQRRWRALGDLPQVVRQRRRARARALARSAAALPAARARRIFTLVPLAVGDASADEVAAGARTGLGRRRDAGRHQHRPLALPAVRRGARRRPRDRRRDPATSSPTLDHARRPAARRRSTARCSPRARTASRRACSTCATRATPRATARAWSAMRDRLRRAAGWRTQGRARRRGARRDARRRADRPRAQRDRARARPAERRPSPAHPALAAPGATFVTLRRRGELRGCIGAPRGRATARRRRAPQRRSRRRFATRASSRSTWHEFAALEIEVSLLEPAAAAARAERGRSARGAAPGRRRRDPRMARPARDLPAAGLGAVAGARASSSPRSSARPACRPTSGPTTCACRATGCASSRDARTTPRAGRRGPPA